MENKFILGKSFVVGICAFVGDKIGIISSALAMFIFLMILDYISGMLAAKKEAIEHANDKRYGWNSRKGIIGIYKKIGYMLTVLVAISMDYIIFNIIDEIGISYKSNTLFGLLVLVWFILNEILSILENVGRMGVKLPNFLIKTITEMKEEVNIKNDLK